MNTVVHDDDLLNETKYLSVVVNDISFFRPLCRN